LPADLPPAPLVLLAQSSLPPLHSRVLPGPARLHLMSPSKTCQLNVGFLTGRCVELATMLHKRAVDISLHPRASLVQFQVAPSWPRSQSVAETRCRVMDRVSDGRLRWYGHVLTSDPTRVAHSVLLLRAPGSGFRGRPKMPGQYRRGPE